MLSTIIECSGVTLCQRLSDNLKQVEQALKAMPDVIDRYHVEKGFAPAGTSAKGRRLDDAKIVLRPTQAFTVEQMKTNMHINRLDTAVIAEDGGRRETRARGLREFMDYERAKEKYQGGRRITPTKIIALVLAERVPPMNVKNSLGGGPFKLPANATLSSVPAPCQPSPRRQPRTRVQNTPFSLPHAAISVRSNSPPTRPTSAHRLFNKDCPFTLPVMMRPMGLLRFGSPLTRQQLR